MLKSKNPVSVAVLTYALSSVRVTLGEGSEQITVADADGALKFRLAGVHFATVRVEAGDLVVALRKPRQLDADLTAALARYKELKHDWLEFRTPVSREPRPWLEAELGRMAGRTRRELALAAKHS